MKYIVFVLFVLIAANSYSQKHEIVYGDSKYMLQNDDATIWFLKDSLEDGDWVDIISQHGCMKAVAVLFPGIRPDTLMGQHGWWQGCDALGIPESSTFDGGTNPNVLYDWTQRDDITADITKNTLVRIEKASPPNAIDPIQEVK